MDNSKPKQLVTAEEVEDISRKVLTWANRFPGKPVPLIKYEYLEVDETTGDETGMALATIQGAYITARYILGGHKAEYQFKLIYRLKPAKSNDKRLKADAMLNRFGDWARENLPDLGEGVRAIRVEPTTQSSKFAAYEDGYEDYQILMKLTYEVI